MASEDLINENGLQLKDYNALLNEIQTGLNQIYAKDGDLINFDSETPDGQFTNIFAQMLTDLRETAQNVYNSFNPDTVEGTTQDMRYALNFIERKGGAFTIVNIDIEVNQTVTLNGLDGNFSDPFASSYTVSDSAGNLWYLADTTTITEGTVSLPFRSQNYGAFSPTIGTITNQVTKVIGVVSVNNSAAPVTLGETQETDAEFRARRALSTSVKGQNNYDAMLGQILALDTVIGADVWVNNTNSTDETGTPANTVWVIVEGGANSDIANAIYQNSGGLMTRGNVSVDVPASSGQVFQTSFDRPTSIPLYIRFDFQLTGPENDTNIEGVKEYIAENLIYGLGESAETSKITNIAREGIVANGGGGYALNIEISTDDATYTDYIVSASRANKFVIDTTRISANVIQAE